MTLTQNKYLNLSWHLLVNWYNLHLVIDAPRVVISSLLGLPLFPCTHLCHSTLKCWMQPNLIPGRCILLKHNRNITTSATPLLLVDETFLLSLNLHFSGWLKTQIPPTPTHLSSYQINSELREVPSLQCRAHARDATSSGETLGPLTNGARYLTFSAPTCLSAAANPHAGMSQNCNLHVSHCGSHIREPTVMDAGFRAQLATVSGNVAHWHCVTASSNQHSQEKPLGTWEHLQNPGVPD